MRWGVLICGLLYNVVIIAAVTIWLKVHAKKHNLSEDFILSGRDLPWYVIGATIALTGIGGGHINGLTAQAWATGYTTLWYCIAHGFAFTLMLRLIAPWFRRMGFLTIPDCFTKMFGPSMGVLVTGLTTGTIICAIIMETQGLGVIIEATTGLAVLPATIIGVIIGILYVIFAGMKEIGWVNLINAILMYVFGIVLLVYVGMYYDGGWQGITDALIANGDERLLHSFGDWNTVKTYVVGCIISCIFGISFSQQGIQPAFTSKSMRALKSAVWTAIPLNVCFGVIVLSLGLAAKVAPATAGVPAGNVGAILLCTSPDVVPAWVSVCTIGIFLAAVLSTFAMASLGAATLVVTNIQTPYFTKDRYMTPKQQTKWCRIWIVLCSIVSIVVAGWGGDSINIIIVWFMSFTVPLFFIWFFGLFWKRSTSGAIITLVVCWIVNCVLTLTGLASVIGLEGNNYSIAMFVLSTVIYVICAACDTKKSRKAYKKVYLEQHKAYLEDLKARGLS